MQASNSNLANLAIDTLSTCDTVQDTVRSSTPRRISSQALLEGGGELLIDHHGREYRLRLTSNGKLILTA